MVAERPAAVRPLRPAGPESEAPLFTQLHVISIHVRDHAAYDAVFRFFRDVLALPHLYGTTSKPEQKGKTLYSGFAAGNAYFEPCGPYKPDDPYTDAAPARFFGLTFHTARAVADVVAAVEQRGLLHAGVIPFSGTKPPAQPTRFVPLRDTELIGGRRMVSIWRPGDDTHPADPVHLQERLLEAAGGTLGVIRVEEVWLGGADPAGRAKWARLLSPYECEGDVYRIGNGPALRLFAEGPNDLRAVVLKVSSLERAKAFLRRRLLLGPSTADSAELDASRVFGLRIILRE